MNRSEKFNVIKDEDFWSIALGINNIDLVYFSAKFPNGKSVLWSLRWFWRLV